MKVLIAYISVEHGNTEKVARTIAEALGAYLKEANEIDPSTLSTYDLIGLGSGIFKGKFHPALLKFIDSIPKSSSKTFVFSTGGYGSTKYHSEIKGILKNKGLDVLGEFACKGWDTYGPFKLMGGINKGRPNEDDLNHAREFARDLLH